MLRISVHNNPQTSRSSSKGGWQGPGCGNSRRAGRAPWPISESILRVDLTGVTFIDDAGKACLAAMHRRGRTRRRRLPDKRHVAEITQASFPEDGELTTTT